MRQKDRNDYKRVLGRYKIQDDHSGFEVFDDKIVLDQYGYASTKNNYDPVHPTQFTESQLRFPIDQPIPFRRTELPDYFINAHAITTYEVWNLESGTWDQVTSPNITWDISDSAPINHTS